MDALRNDQHYTYADYCTWDDDERWELINGVPYLMAPGSTRSHQSISGKIFLQIGIFLQGKPCKVYAAPFDVRLNADDGDDIVVQPDILVVCDQSKLNNANCAGAPDMIVEILSPSTAGKDRHLKFNAYQKYGVREYWIVDPDSRTVSVHILKNGEYTTYAYAEPETVPVRVLDGCTVTLSDVFAE